MSAPAGAPGRFLLVADRREGIWLVVDTVRCVVMRPCPGDACESPEAFVAAAAASPPAPPLSPHPEGVALFAYEQVRDLG